MENIINRNYIEKAASFGKAVFWFVMIEIRMFCGLAIIRDDPA